MPARLEDIFIITSERDYLPFFNRQFGDSGRDIAAVKTALGSVYTNTLDGEQPEDNSIGTSWFECGTNEPISESKLKKFDKKLRLDLMAFQMTYQFVIISYYFEKYCAYEVFNETELRNKVQAAMSLFDSEFGTIGEGSLAVMHGWRPNSVPTNKSFVTDYERILDEVPKEIYNYIQQEIITSPPAEVASFIQFNTPEYQETRDYFNLNSHSKKKIAARLGLSGNSGPVYASYTAASVGADMKESQLYVAAQSIMNSDLARTPQELTASDTYRAIAPMLEPDHLSDPAPFEISQNVIGVFQKTEFTMENLPDFSLSDSEYIAVIEDEALTSVLKYYNKPLIWNMKEDVLVTDTFTLSDEASQQVFAGSEQYKVTTNTTINEYSLTEYDYSSRYTYNLNTFNGRRPVRFIEFRTPSLRPGDVYRAYFEVDKKLIDRIETGVREGELATTNQASIQSSVQMSALQADIESNYCIEASSTDDAAQAKFEKYKAFAMKRKLEISREIRNKALLAAAGNDVGIEVDLGVFGNIPLANLLDGTSLSREELGANIGGAIVNALDSKFEANPGTNPLAITFSDLETGIESLVKIFSSKEAKEDVNNFKISGTDFKLDLDAEASKLSPIPELLRGLVLNNSDFQEKAAESERTEEEILEFKPQGAISGTFGSQRATKIKITFTESGPPSITKIELETSDTKVGTLKIYEQSSQDYEPLTGVLSTPRTVNYLQNIYNLIPLGVDSWSQAAEQLIGLGSSPCSDSQSVPGARLIMKYTINSDGTPISLVKEETPFNPLHDWKNDYKQREEYKRVSELFRKEWVKEVEWGIDEALPVIGPSCTLDELYRDFVKRFNLGKLLCDFVACLNIPGVNIKLPNLNIPEIPEIPIFQYPGLDFKKLAEQLDALLLRVICAFARNLLDILSSPFCQEQLINDIYGAASDTSPDIQRAFASALIDTGVPNNKNVNASSMIEDVVNFLTPRELCALLQGQPVNRQVYNVIQNLAKNYDLETELDSREKIVTFFQSIGVYIPDELCSNLSNGDNILGAENCQDTANILMSVRLAASRGEVDEEQVKQAVAQAEKNLMDKATALKMITGEMSLADLVPEIDSAEIAENKALNDATEVAVNSALSIVKQSFLSSMGNYVPSMFLDITSLVSIDDSEYDPVATMRFLRAVNNLQKVSGLNFSNINLEDQALVSHLRKTIQRLCDDFEKMEYGEFEIYRSQLYPPEDTTDADQNEEQVNSSRSGEDGYSINYENIKTSLRGSLMFGHDLTEEYKQQTGIYGLETSDTDLPETDYERLVQFQEEYKPIFDYMFPMNLRTVEPPPEGAPEGSTGTIVTSVISSWQEWNQSRFEGEELSDGTAEGSYREENIPLNVSLMEAVGKIISRYQQDIEQTVEKVFKVVNKEKLLEVIRDFYNIELEALREEEQTYAQLIKTKIIPAGQDIILEHPNIGLMKTIMSDRAVSRDYISNQTEVQDEFFLGSPDVPRTKIILCEEVPEEYKEAYDDSGSSTALRRKVFKQQLFETARRLYNKYYLTNMNYIETLPSYSKFSDADSKQYLDVLEGTTEQLVSFMGNSRIFSDPAYLQRIESKLKSRPFYTDQGSSSCLVNPFGTLSSGPVRFDELVTDFFPNQYIRELRDPENSLYTQDYSKPAAFEKAMMATTLLGFIRTVCLEALLKGAIAYSTWDVEFVSSDPLFLEYMTKLILNSIDKQPGFVENSILVDDAFSKISGTNNRKLAISAILRNELKEYVNLLSKVIFENSVEEDYSTWFLRRLPLVNAPWRRREDLPQIHWVSELSERDINAFRKNSFTYLERYIRTNGEFNVVVGDRSDLAVRQRDALYEFIRFNDPAPYPIGFYAKLYVPTDLHFMAIPILLDIPSAQDVALMGIEEASTEVDTEIEISDDDRWPDTELWSLEDFDQILRKIFSANRGVEKFIFHLLKKYHDSDGTEPGFHGVAKTLRRKLPVKIVKRKRTHIKIDGKDLFSAKLREDFDPVVFNALTPAGSQGAHLQPRSTDAKTYYEFITGETIGEVSYQSEFVNHEKTVFEDRHYIFHAKATELFEDDFEPNAQIGLGNSHNRGNSNKTAPRRSLTMEVKDTTSFKSPWQASTLNSVSPIDTIAGLDQEWVPSEVRGKNVFQNTSGRVSEEFYQDFSERMGDLVEEEIWEEYIVDLVGQASPTFNQPGNSAYIPSDNLSGAQKRRIADALARADRYLQNRVQEREALYKTSPSRSSVFKHDEINEGAYGYVTQALETSPVRGPGFINKEDGIEGKTYPSSGYAYFENQIRLKYNPTTTVYSPDESSEELLGENDYKVPLRMLITQVKDSSGNIKQCYVKYLSPEVVTFGEEISVNRETLLTDATVAAIQGYEDFMHESWYLATTDNNTATEYFRANWPWFYSEDPNRGAFGNFAQHRPDEVKIRADGDVYTEYLGSARASAVNWLMGRRGSSAEYNGGEGRERGALPVLLRSSENQHPGFSSGGTAFLSTEKIWSQTAQLEAKRKIGNFREDSETTDFSVFDEFFEKGIGSLLRKPSANAADRNFESFISQVVPAEGQLRAGFTAPLHYYEDGEGKDLTTSDYLRKRYRAYFKGSMHSFYSKSVTDLVAENINNEAVHSIGNLVSWYGQRRIDGFYGVTSHVVRGHTLANMSKGIRIDPKTITYRSEAADYDCGPSLFYGDNRMLAEIFAVNLKHHVLRNETSLSETDKVGYYRGILSAFRLQNAYKVNITAYKSTESQSFYGEQEFIDMNPRYRERTEKTKTLVTQNTDALLSSVALNRMLTFVQNTGRLSEIPNGLVDNGFDLMPESQENVVVSYLRGANLREKYINHKPVYLDPNFHDISSGGFVDPYWDFSIDANRQRVPEEDRVISMDLQKNYDSELDIDTEYRNFGLSIVEEEGLFSSLTKETMIQTLQRLNEDFEQALRWADPLIQALTNISAGIAADGVSFSDQLEIKHGLRLNLVLSHDVAAGGRSKTGTAEFIKNAFNEESEVGEEERTGRVFYNTGRTQDDSTPIYEEYVSIPVASHEKLVGTLDICEPNVGLSSIIPTILSRDAEMIKSLSEEKDFKAFYDFSIPHKRISSLLTVHSTSMLAGYNTMPTVLTSTKASLANVFSIMANRNNFDANMGTQFGANFNAADIMAAMGTNFPAGGEPLGCFDLSGLNKDWFKMIAEMIENFIKYFPSVIFRGIADQLDPAYKEMKSHYYACEIPTLNFESVTYLAGGKKTEFGLKGSEMGSKSYVPINVGFPIDATIGIAKMLNLFNSDGGAYFGKSLDRMTSYLVGAPPQLIDASYAFQVPCMEATSGRFRDWEKYEIGTYGRYGHPLSLFTLLALPTMQLPRDIEYKNQMCTLSELQQRGITPTVCSDDED